MIMNVFKCACGISYRKVQYTRKVFNLESTVLGKFLGVELFDIVPVTLQKRLTTTSKAPQLQDEIHPGSNVQSSEEAMESIRLQRIRKALKFQLKENEDAAKLLQHQETEFLIGKRHLANMMGMDPDTITQKDINNAIEYLMPSGLTEKRARPMMKPPGELVVRNKGMDIGINGRPLNTFFFTGRGNFYAIFHDASHHLEKLNNFEDQQISKGHASPPPEAKLAIEDSEWISFKDLKKRLDDDTLSETEYKALVEILKRVLEHPYSFRAKDFLMQHRVIKQGFGLLKFPPLTVGKDGIPYVKATGYRKQTRAEVIVRGKGSGKVKIQGYDIGYFQNKQDREQIMFPLKCSGLLNQVDVQAIVKGTGGNSAESGAIRHGISLALCSFVTSDVIQQMRLAGLLQKDFRRRERKKYGHKGARAQYSWKKR